MRRELLVGRRGAATLAALREDGRTVELYVEPPFERAEVGRIYKARVSRVLPGIQSAFLDFGAERDAFLHARDLVLPGESPRASVLGEEAEGGDELTPAVPATGAVADGDRPPIEDRLKSGRELLVQISRESLGEKGPRSTCYLSFPGHLLVLFPQLANRGVSRRIEDAEERERLLEILGRLPGNVGFVARTAARGVGEAALVADAEQLLENWEAVQRRFESARAPSVLFREADLLVRLLRDISWEDLERIVFDHPDDRARADEYFAEIAPGLSARVELHDGPKTLLEAYDVQRDVERLMRPKVWLKSGGYLVIQETEALISIDVNTGKFVGGRRAGETVLRTNLEAADEIARQLRLRDLGGIIVIDFIDMEPPEQAEQVEQALRAALTRDRARTNVVGFSELGLVQLTRKRTRPGVRALLTRPCPLCSGLARIKSPEAVAADAVAEAQRLSAAGSRSLIVRLHPDNVAALREALAATGGMNVEVEAAPGMPPHGYDVR